MNEEHTKIEEQVEVEVPEHNEEEKPKELNALTLQPKKAKKHIEAKQLVEEAKNIVAASDSEMKDCKLILEEDLHDFNVAKKDLHMGGLDEVKVLLSAFGYKKEKLLNEENEQSSIFETDDKMQAIKLKDINSGKFTGFILSLFAGLVTFIGLIYLVTKELGITLDIKKVPTNETITHILTWFSTAVGLKENMYVGAAILAVTILIVMILVYIIRVGLKAASNLRFANEQMKETQKYIIYKSNCKIEMDRVDVHIKNAIKILKDYEVVLNEQDGKLKRILHFEGTHANLSDYHDKSVAQMKETSNLVEYINDFITTPMSKEGKLSEDSTRSLHSAKVGLDNFLTAVST